ncbi:MAG: hypothetical protein JWR34_7565 [Mycobacterium sp.]|nr:hypothetical protein [Mycobacterium sp.]
MPRPFIYDEIVTYDATLSQDDLRKSSKLTLCYHSLGERCAGLFGLPADEAYEMCHRPLPDIDDVTLPSSA